MKYKVGDKILIKSLDWYNKNKTKHGDVWFDNAVFTGGQSLYCGCELTIRSVEDDRYYVNENDYYWMDEMIERLAEEEIKSEDGLLNEYEELTDRAFKGGYEKCKSDIELNGFQLPEGYIFKDENDNVINATKIVLEKKKKEYPKTYEECLNVLGYEDIATHCIFHNEADEKLFNALYYLKVCRDAYWKIAGEEMGLDGSWEPDWTDQETPKYCIAGVEGQIKTAERYIVNTILAFPTAEMRDAFYESFKKEIEICKELL